MGMPVVVNLRPAGVFAEFHLASSLENRRSESQASDNAWDYDPAPPVGLPARSRREHDPL